MKLSHRSGAGLLLIVALVAGVTWWLQAQEAEALRAELALLRDERGEFLRLSAENRRLTADQPPPAEVERLRADRAAILRLRAEIETLKAAAEMRARAGDGR
jgi:predicted aminopeptidase